MKLHENLAVLTYFLETAAAWNTVFDSITKDNKTIDRWVGIVQKCDSDLVSRIYEPKKQKV